MSVTYSKCGADVAALVKKVIKAHHPDLLEAEVKVGCLYAHPELNQDGEPRAPAVKVGGYPCAAKVRKTNLKERTTGHPDAEIIIAHDIWEGLSEDQQAALIDHEVTHLVVVRDDKGVIQSDDQGRPKLKTRLHDAQVGIFKEVIERHGRAALDGDIARSFIKEYGQLVLWAEEPASVG